MEVQRPPPNSCSPEGVFVDTPGISSSPTPNNNVIREVVASTGKIQTVAERAVVSGDGGPATSAELFYPQGIFVDTAGNIFIADTNINVSVEVVAATGKIQTVAGNGTELFSGDGGPATSAELDSPSGVFVDTPEISSSPTLATTVSGDCFIATTGKIQTVAGGGSNGLGDGGPATSAELDFL